MEGNLAEAEAPAVKPIFACDQCSITFVVDTCLAAHKMIEHGNPPPHNCPLCQTAFYNASVYGNHLMSHSLPRRVDNSYQCCMCSVSFPSAQGLRVHITGHSGATYLSRGMAGPEKRPKFFHCNLCPAVTESLERLNEHVKIHGGSKPYQCDECSRVFRLESNLKTHKRRHRELRHLPRQAQEEYFDQVPCGGTKILESVQRLYEANPPPRSVR